MTSRNASSRGGSSSSRGGSSSSRGSSSSSRKNSSSADDGHRPDTPSPAALAHRAAEELAELLGREPEGIVSLERADDGWRVGVEMLEIRRIPNTADVLAEYDVDADDQGHLTSYRRTRRYTRGHVDEDR